MTIKLEIHPSSTSLDLLGPPDPSSTYSLSGHISLSLPSSHSLFERRRALRILIRSLVITFEGQAELVANETAYTAARLCSISKELASDTIVELSNAGGEDGEQHCTSRVTFDLAIPGWLPASDQYGDCRVGYSGTQYNLYAKMKFAIAEETTNGSSWVSTFCTVFSPKNKVIRAGRCGVTLNRFAVPPPSSVSQRLFSLTIPTETPHLGADPHQIPTDILSKVELSASVPNHVNLDEEKFPFVLRLRASESQAANVRVSHVSVELRQVEDYISSASAYPRNNLFPKEQPPTKVLREAHHLHTFYHVGLLSRPLSFAFRDTHSLLPGCDRLNFLFDPADTALKCAEGTDPNGQLAIKTHIPFTRTLSRHKEDTTTEWVGTPHLRATSQGPFFVVKHTLRVAVTLSYGESEDGMPQPPTSTLTFTLPLNFARFRCAARSRSPTPPSSPERSPSSGAPTLPATIPLSQSCDVAELPAYSQLFYPNGDIRHDDSIPLPLYTPASVLLPKSGDVSKNGHSTCEDLCLRVL